MITERMLRKWRKEALETIASSPKMVLSNKEIPPGEYKAMVVPDTGSAYHILIMTQELLDQHLLRRGK